MDVSQCKVCLHCRKRIRLAKRSRERRRSILSRIPSNEDCLAMNPFFPKYTLHHQLIECTEAIRSNSHNFKQITISNDTPTIRFA